MENSQLEFRIISVIGQNVKWPPAFAKKFYIFQNDPAPSGI